MEFIVLGLLLMKKMTIYELNVRFRENLSLIYSASYGSLQNAVRKLQKEGYIVFNEAVERGRNKKYYSINEAGKEAFYRWMKQEIPLNKVETVMLSKLFFLGYIETEEVKLMIVENMLTAAKSQYNELKALEKQVSALIIPAEARNRARYQLKTLDYGLMAHSAAVKWLETLYREIKKG